MTSQISFVKCVTQLQHGRKSLLTKSSSIYLSTKCTARSHFIQECTPPAVFPQPGQAQAPSTLHEKMKDLRIIISLSAIIGTSTIVYSLPISVSALSFPLVVLGEVASSRHNQAIFSFQLHWLPRCIPPQLNRHRA